MQTLFVPQPRKAVNSRRQAAMLAASSAYLVLWIAGVVYHWMGGRRTIDHDWFAIQRKDMDTLNEIWAPGRPRLAR